MMGWTAICSLDDILPNCGVGAWLDGQDIALFRVRDAIYAIGNRDPASGAHVLSRGLVGDLDGEVVVASPIYKQHFSLITGKCLENADWSVPVFLCCVHEGSVFVRPRPAARKRLSRSRLVVVGNGMAAIRVIEELLEHAPQRHDIEVFSAESHGGYNRILLSPLLAGDKQKKEVLTHPPEWFSAKGVLFHGADPIVSIDRARKIVVAKSGLESGYDRLLIATGSTPIKLPIPGSNLSGVVTFRDLEDVDAMVAAARQHRRAVVIGGGLLGLEAASGLHKRGMQVTVVHAVDRLMERQLDLHAATLLQEELERRGITFTMSAKTIRLTGQERVDGLELDDGRAIPADMVVMAVGIRPNISLARSAGLLCDRGILVDDSLMTQDPAIYAVGECVQHRGATFGLVAPLYEQARVCATHLAERPTRGYRMAPTATLLKVSGIDVFSAGNFAAESGTESLVMRDPRRGVYKRLVLKDDRVRGAVLYGDVGDSTWYMDLITEGRDIGAIRQDLLFGAPQGSATNTA
jgi:nitrite reductase (NADH) large subunit